MSDYTPLRRRNEGPIPSLVTDNIWSGLLIVRIVLDMGTDEGSNPSLTILKIKETNIGGHIILRPACDDCPTCGEEMTDIIYFGEVCVLCDSKNLNENKTVEL